MRRKHPELMSGGEASTRVAEDETTVTLERRIDEIGARLSELERTMAENSARRSRAFVAGDGTTMMRALATFNRIASTATSARE